MSLTIQEIYDRYSVREFTRLIEVKRRKTDNSYEDNWQSIELLSGQKELEGNIKSIDFSIANDSFSFGIVNVGNMKMIMNSKYGEFDDETNQNSIFYGFLRHKSQIRVRDGFVDKYTDPNNPINIYTNVFQGFIDETSESTKVDDDNVIQYLQCIDILSFLLKSYTKADMGALTSTNINDLVYEILNRSEFTDFFSVDIGNIDAGYNISSFDISQYEGQTQLFTIFEDFSVGHSFFYIRDSIFYYKDIKKGNPTSLEINNRKIIKFANYDNGSKNVFEKLYWEDSNESYTSPTNKYNKTKTFNVKGCTNSTQRQNLLNFIGTITRIQRKKVKLEIPYYPLIFILDELQVVEQEIIPSDALVWDAGLWDVNYWRNSISASYTSNVGNWLVKEVKHNNYQTTLILEEVV